MTEKSELYQLFDPTLRKLSNDELAELEAIIKNFQLPRYSARELKARAGKSYPTPEEDYLKELKKLRDYNLRLRELGEEDAGSDRTPASEEEGRVER